MEHLFVYGTLQRGHSNAGMLERIGGTWIRAFVHGHLHDRGWGATEGYPAIKLDPSGPRVHGYIFSSESLCEHWSELDEFEGQAYQRVLTSVSLENGSTVNAYLYQLNDD